MQRTRRRRFLLAAAALAAAPLARGQAPAGKRTLGILSPHPRPSPAQQARSPYFGRLAQLGWRLGENLHLERPEHPDGEAALPRMAEELVRKRVDAILAIGPEAAVAAVRATQSIPIVFCCVAFAVEQRLVRTYAQPGGNVTGVAFWTGPEVVTKLLELFREIAPDVRRLAGLSTPGSLDAVDGSRHEQSQPLVDAAARSVGLEYRLHPLTAPGDLDAVLAGILDSGAQGLLSIGTTAVRRAWRRIAEFASRNRLPHAATAAEFAEAGALFSYGASTTATVLQSFEYADKVLRGASPADLPVLRPAAYELVLNQRAARDLGRTFPQAVLLRADRVIE